MSITAVVEAQVCFFSQNANANANAKCSSCFLRAAGLEKPGLLVHNYKFNKSQTVFIKCRVWPHPALGSVHNNKSNTRHMGFRFWLNNAQTIPHLGRFPKLRAARGRRRKSVLPTVAAGLLLGTAQPRQVLFGPDHCSLRPSACSYRYGLCDCCGRMGH